jgi:serine/threonine protein kinase
MFLKRKMNNQNQNQNQNQINNHDQFIKIKYKTYGLVEEPEFNNIATTSSQYPIILKRYKSEECGTVYHDDTYKPNYEYVRKLSDGSESNLYVVAKNNVEYIMKKIPKYNNNWRKELYILTKIYNSASHDRLLRWVDYYENYKYAYIVTEYCGMHDLARYVDTNSCFSLENVRKITMSMLLALKQCHDLDIVHLDIKCENFIVSDNNVFDLILIDFGHSEIILPGPDGISRGNDIIEGNFNYGTIDYLCPEGHQMIYSKKSDIWSIGICVFVMLTGNFLFKREEQVATFEAYKNRLNLLFARHADMLSDDLAKDFILQCLKYKPEERPFVDQLLGHPFVNNLGE